MKRKVTSLNNKLSKLTDYCQRHAAHALSTQWEKLSSSQKKITTLILGILIGCFCIYLILKPSTQSISDSFPFETDTSLVTPLPQERAISTQDYLLLINFKTMLDSLYKTDPNTYHEILQGRQGLLDSIDFLIRLYK